jgi:hypothetical protein
MASNILNYTSTKVVLAELAEKAAYAKHTAEMAELEYQTMNAHYMKATEEMLMLKKQLDTIDAQIPQRHAYDSPEARAKRLNAEKKASRERLNLLGLGNRRTEADRRAEAIEDAEAVRFMSSFNAAAWLANKKVERASISAARRAETKHLVDKIYKVLNALE